MEKASKQDYSLTCLQCSKSFLSFSSRRRHEREKHEGKMFSCDVCKKDMVPSSKHYHLKNCQVKSPHVVAQKQCDSCGNFFHVLTGIPVLQQRLYFLKFQNGE